MNQKQIEEQAKQHWREEYPAHYRQLVAENRLEREATAAAKLTLMEMQTLMRVGISEDSAWEASRHLFVLTDPVIEE